MDTERFETFIDAILAIMITVMVLKIPQPETLSIQGIWDLRIMYFAYIVSFIVIFSIWDHHRQFFDSVESIDDTVIVMYSILIFFVTFIPYFTAWVAHKPYDLMPELMFGLLFFVVNILLTFCSALTIKKDVHNDFLREISFNRLFLLNTLLFILGLLLVFYVNPFWMILICVVILINWNLVTYIKDFGVGDNNEN